MSKPRLPPKKDVALALLENTTVFLHLDPRDQDVRVPPWFKRQPQLVLQIGLNMAVPIPDLTVDDEGISCTLSFSRNPHLCVIPWKAIYALVGEDGRGMVWPDDVPPEVAAQAQAQSKEKRGHLRAVPAEEQRKQAASAEKSAKPDAPVAVAVAPAEARPERKTKKRQIGAAPNPKKSEAAARPAKQAPPPPVHSASSAEAGDAKKSKRELPPYLRVVK
jgi:stringent starvation protein B